MARVFLGTRLCVVLIDLTWMCICDITSSIRLQVYLVTEMLRGGELLDMILLHGHLYGSFDIVVGPCRWV